MSSVDRIVGLRRHFPLSAIAGILGTDRETVRAVLRGEAQLPPAGGSGALVVEAAAELAVDAVTPADLFGWSDAPEFLPLGPIHVEAGPHLVTGAAQAIGDSVAGDAVNLALYTIEDPDVRTATPVISGVFVGGPGWPTTMWGGGGPATAPGVGAGWQLLDFVVPTDLYLLCAASNAVGDGPPTAPVTVRNRHLSVLPL